MTKTIVCFGDSNTHGYNAENMGRFNENERWTGLLDKLLGDSYLIREEGLSGRTTSFEDPIFEGLSGYSMIHSCLLTHEPVDFLIIMLGTNDVKERFHATPANIAKGLERLTHKAMTVQGAFRDQPNILLIAPPAIEEGYDKTEIFGEMGEGCVAKTQALASLYQQIADQLGCHFLDAGSIDGIHMNPYDHMHLDKESHRLLAEKLAELIPDLCP